MPTWLALLGALAILANAPLQAQVQPAPADTTRPDTVVVPIPPDEIAGDTVPTALREAAAADSVPLSLPGIPDPMALGWGAARWEWTREELSSLPGLTALEFIQRIPGITRFRAGGFGRPEAVTALGMGGGRTRIFIDGWEMDPYVSGAFELETLPLRDIESVRVERALTEIRVDVRTYRLDQAEAHSVVELGTGVYQTRLLRAIFSRGFGRRSTGTGSFDLVSTRGSGIGEPYSHSSSVFRWTYVPRDRLGLEADWRRTAIDREGTVYPRQTTRSDLTIRALARPTERIFLDAIVGRSNQEDLSEGGGSDADDPLETRRSTQIAVRAAYADDVLTADVGARVRGRSGVYPLQPAVDVEGRGALAPLPALRVEGSGRMATWGGGTALGGRLTGTLAPHPAVALFATLEVGSRPVPVLEVGAEDGPDTPLVAALAAVGGAGWRGGAELTRGRAVLGVAAFHTRISPVAPFGQPFDDFLIPSAAEPAFGGEGYARLPVPFAGDALSIEGWYSRILDAEDRPYAPADIGRAGFLFHDLYYGGQLEPTLRVEVIHRGRALVPAAESARFEDLADGYQALDLTLQIRIIDVEAFLIWNNALGNRLAVDLPGGPPATTRIVYGAEWRFRN